MKSVLSSIDLICVVRELSQLQGAYVQKIYHVGDEVVFHLFGGEKRVLRVVIGKLIHLTDYVKENPQVPSNFCMYLRKYFKNAELVEVRQPSYERVVILRFRRRGELLKLIIELFGAGNMIVASDDGVIKHCLRVQRFSYRDIKPRVSYELPPSDFDLVNPDFITFKRLIKSTDLGELVKALAVNIGLGGTYAEEACLLAGVDKHVSAASISGELLKKVYDAVLELIKKAKYSSLSPRVIMKGEQVIDVVPFVMKVYEARSFKEFDSFNQALDFFYARSERLSFEQQRSELVEAELARLKERLERQESHVVDLRRRAGELRTKAFALKNNLFSIEQVLDSLLKARDKGYEWSEIKQMIVQERAEGSEDAVLIKDLRPHDNVVIINLVDGIKLSLNKPVREQMTEFFDQAKKLESKIEGALEAVNRARQELESFSKEEVVVEQSVPKKIDSSGREWFERFKWFRTIEGNLVIAGRNAQQNEELIRKYLEPDDLVFHADIHGSPFAILRRGRKASEQSRREAAQFTAAHSSAWVKGVAVDVFCVKPFQVDKEAPSGEYLRTGGFMIHGRKEFFKNLKPELSLGVEELGELSYRLISGPRKVVRVKSDFIVTLEPGTESQNSVVKEIMTLFKQKGYGFTYETIKAALPDGGLRIANTY